MQKLWCFQWSINRDLCIKININLFSWIYHCYHHSIKLVFSKHEWDTWKYDLIYTYKANIWIFKFYNISWITAKPKYSIKRQMGHDYMDQRPIPFKSKLRNQEYSVKLLSLLLFYCSDNTWRPKQLINKSI